MSLLRGEAPEEADITKATSGLMNPDQPRCSLALAAIVGLSIIGLPVAYAMIGGSILWPFVSSGSTLGRQPSSC